MFIPPIVWPILAAGALIAALKGEKNDVGSELEDGGCSGVRDTLHSQSAERQHCNPKPDQLNEGGEADRAVEQSTVVPAPPPITADGVSNELEAAQPAAETPAAGHEADPEATDGQGSNQQQLEERGGVDVRNFTEMGGESSCGMSGDGICEEPCSTTENTGGVSDAEN